MTLPGTTLGSVHYFSPEQARGEPATASSDIYSLGIVLFEMLTGRRPWEGDSAAAIALARLTGPVPILSDFRSGIPPDLEAIDRKALMVDPADRFASAGAMADALDGFLAERPAGAARCPPDAAAAAAAGAVAGAAVATGLEATRPGTVSGVASPSRAGAVPYASDAYASGDVEIDRAGGCRGACGPPRAGGLRARARAGHGRHRRSLDLGRRASSDWRSCSSSASSPSSSSPAAARPTALPSRTRSRSRTSSA